MSCAIFNEALLLFVTEFLTDEAVTFVAAFSGTYRICSRMPAAIPTHRLNSVIAGCLIVDLKKKMNDSTLWLIFCFNEYVFITVSIVIKSDWSDAFWIGERFRKRWIMFLRDISSFVKHRWRCSVFVWLENASKSPRYHILKK